MAKLPTATLEALYADPEWRSAITFIAHYSLDPATGQTTLKSHEFCPCCQQLISPEFCGDCGQTLPQCVPDLNEVEIYYLEKDRARRASEIAATWEPKL